MFSEGADVGCEKEKSFFSNYAEKKGGTRRGAWCEDG
jgi:hypothetical protein